MSCYYGGHLQKCRCLFLSCFQNGNSCQYYGSTMVVPSGYFQNRKYHAFQKGNSRGDHIREVTKKVEYLL